MERYQQTKYRPTGSEAEITEFVHQKNQAWDVVEQRVALEQAFVLMLGATCRQFDPRSSMPASARYPVRWQQVHDYIDAHLFDAALSPATCAQALNISERYLHKVLSEHDERFSQIVQSRRLDASAARLRDPRLNRSRISSVAYQCGFKDAAHFSRAFSMRFGMAPRVWRAQQRTAGK